MEHRSHGIPTGTTWCEWEQVQKEKFQLDVVIDDVIDFLRVTPSSAGPDAHMEFNRILPEPRRVPKLVVLKTCKHAPTDVDLHTCPYAADVNNDTTPCNCCDECVKTCADEI